MAALSFPSSQDYKPDNTSNLGHGDRETKKEETDDASSTTTGRWTDATDMSRSPSPSPDRREPVNERRQDELFWGHPSSLLTRDAVPWPGSTYIVIHMSTGRALALLHGRVQLVGPPLFPLLQAASPPQMQPPTQAATQTPTHPTPSPIKTEPHPQTRKPQETLTGCHHWTVVQSAGWLGLRNLASWTFLGRDFPGRMQASAPHHRWWEFLCARRHPSGGYILMNVNCVAHVLEKIGIGIAKEGEGEGEEVRLVGEEEEGAVWEFVRLD